MKPVESNDAFVSSAQDTVDFTMNTSADTFELFSNHIYEHKIRAVVRELSCNAFDAHVDAGKREQPFRIHFPTVFEPFFEIEDYGIGLDDYDVRGHKKNLYDEDGNIVSTVHEGGIYTRYFESTKRDSNDSVGHLGLGSKSPLSYTKSMSITTRKDGVQYEYLCFVGDNGKPQTKLTGTSETDEQNGVCIRFSVSPKDNEEFIREAGFVLATFKVKPTTNKEIDYLLSDDEVKRISENGCLVIPDKHVFKRHEPAMIYCEMAGVIYPVRMYDENYVSYRVMINEDQFNTGEDDEPVYYTFDETTKKMLNKFLVKNNSSIIVRFDNGSLRFMPSRESLSQDEATRFMLYKTLFSVFEYEVGNMQTRINSARQPLEAYAFYRELFDRYESFQEHTFEWNNCKIHDIAFKSPFKMSAGDFRNPNIVAHYSDYRGMFGTDKVMRTRGNIYAIDTEDLYEQIKNSGTVEVFYSRGEDEFKGLTNVIRHYVKEIVADDNQLVFFFKGENPGSETFKHFKDVFYGNVKFRPISEMVEEVKQDNPEMFEKKKRKGKSALDKVSSKNEIKAYVLANTYLQSSIDLQTIIDLSEIDCSRTAYVVATKGDTLTLRFGDQSNHVTVYANWIMEYLDKFKSIDRVIYMNSINAKKIKKAGIRPLEDILMEELESDNRMDNCIKYIATRESRLMASDPTTDRNGLTDSITFIREFLRGYTEYRYGMREDILGNLYEIGDNLFSDGLNHMIDDFRDWASDNVQYTIDDAADLHWKVAISLHMDKKNELEKAIDEKYYEFSQRLGELVVETKETYPLMFPVSDDNMSIFTDYVKMVNEHTEKANRKSEAA